MLRVHAVTLNDRFGVAFRMEKLYGVLRCAAGVCLALGERMRPIISHRIGKNDHFVEDEEMQSQKGQITYAGLPCRQMRGSQGLDIYFQAVPVLIHLEDIFPSFIREASSASSFH